MSRKHQVGVQVTPLAPERMSMAISKQKDYEVQAKLELVVSITISAVDLDKAVEISKGFTETDFVDMHGDYLDGKFRITGVYESNPSERR